MQISIPDINNQQKIERNIKRKVIILSIFYFLVTVTYSSFSVVVIYIHQKYNHKGYGETYLTANSFSSTLTYIFCPFILAKANNKSKFLLISCAVGYLINMLIPALLSIGEGSHNTSQPPSTVRFLSQIFANIIGGIASGLFWVMQSIYIANYCDGLPQNNKGEYMGISNAILNSRIIVGPLITMVGLGLGNQSTYFILLSFIVIISLPIGIYYIPPIDLLYLQKQKLSTNTENDNQIEQGNGNQTNICKYLLSYLKYFKQIRNLILCSILAGLVVSFVSSSLSHFLPKPGPNQSNDSKIAIALIFFGIGNIVGGYLSGYLSDKLSIKKAGYIGNFLVILGSIIQAICLFTTKAFWKSCIIGFMSGLTYSYIFSYVSIVCTIYYKGNSFSFATNKQITSFSYIGYQWTVNFLNDKCNMKLNMTYQGLALIPLAIVSAYCIYAQTKKHQKQIENISQNQKQLQIETKSNEQYKQTNSQLGQ